MKFVKKTMIAIAISSAFVATANAGNMYAGVKAGSVSNSVPGLSESSTSFGVFGGYTINPNFAVELGYTDLGSVGGLINFSAIDLSAVGTFPVSGQFSLYGKLGMASTTESALGFSVSRTDVTYGVGGEYKVSETVGIRLGWDHYGFGDDVTFIKGDSSLISVSGVFKF